MKHNTFEINRKWQVEPISLPKNHDKKNKRKEKNFTIYSLNVGFYVMTPIFLGVIIGLMADKKFGTKPLFFLFFIFFGLVSSFYNLWRLNN